MLEVITSEPEFRLEEQLKPTVADALRAEIARRGGSLRRAARAMNTTVQNVSRWAHPGIAIEPDGDHIDAVQGFLGLDDREMGALVIATKRQRAELRRRGRHNPGRGAEGWSTSD